VQNDAIQPALERASLSELLDLQTGYADGAAKLKARLDAVKAELARRYGESAKQALTQQDKEHGSGKLALQDGFAVEYKIDREVKWDSDKLMAVAQTLPWERVQALFKIAFSMPEKIYAGVAALSPELREKIDAARTTRIKDPAITLRKEEPLA
jgi:hypothetical protein